MLSQVKVRHISAVIDLGCGANPVGALAQVDFIQVKLKDFVLGQFSFDLDRQENFIQFSHIGFFPRQEKIARHLHGDGAAALFFLPGPGQGDSGAHQSLPVNSGMVEEAVVFRGYKGLYQLFRCLVDGNRRAPLFTEFPNQRPVLAVHAQGDLHAHIAQHFDIRQVGDDKIDRGAGGYDKYHRQCFE